MQRVRERQKREDVPGYWGGSEGVGPGHWSVNLSLSPVTQAKSRTTYPPSWTFGPGGGVGGAHNPR